MQVGEIKQNKISRSILYVIFLCFCIPLLSSCASNRVIVNGLDEKEANEILVFLSNKGIEATKVAGKDTGGGGGNKITLWDISVSEDQSREAMSLLNQNGLPRRRGQNLLGIFSNSGLVPSEMEQQIRYQAGLAEQLASTIRKIDGVLDAEVQISFPKDDPLNPGKTSGKISASVYVKHSGVLDDPNSHLVTKIKRLIAASVTGLDYDNVTVIPDRARFNEAPLGGSISSNEEDKAFVSVWSIIVAKDSMTRFQVIFFSFIVAILTLLLALLWLGWKFLPVIQKQGMQVLFHLQPIETGEVVAEKDLKNTIEEKKSPPTTDQGQADKDIDET
jgi:type III secretion protein J